MGGETSFEDISEVSLALFTSNFLKYSMCPLTLPPDFSVGRRSPCRGSMPRGTQRRLDWAFPARTSWQNCNCLRRAHARPSGNGGRPPQSSLSGQLQLRRHRHRHHRRCRRGWPSSHHRSFRASCHHGWRRLVAGRRRCRRRHRHRHRRRDPTMGCCRRRLTTVA